MRVVVIGNSRDLLDREDGKKIDQCDRIIRLNSFRIEGHEKNVGSRVDIVSLLPHPELVKNDYPECIHLFQQAKEFWTPWWRDHCTQEEIDDLMNLIQRPAHELILADDTGHKDFMLSCYDQVYQYGENRPGLKTQAEDGKKFIPTTGFLTIRLARARFPEAELFITGFGLNSELDGLHFSTCPGPIWDGHDLVTERALNLKSIEKGEFQKL